MAYRNSDKYHLDIGSGVTMPISNSDPWFNLGSLLGGLWGKNYNDRGAAKATAKANELLAQQEQPQSFSAAAMQGMENANARLGLPQGDVPNNPYASGNYVDANARFGLPVEKAQQQAISAGQPQKFSDIVTIGNKQVNGVNPTLRQGTSRSGETASKGAQTPERNLAAEKQDYIYNKYNSGSANPDGDSTAAAKTADVMRANIGGLDFSKMPGYTVEDIQSALRAELAKDGRNEYQINKALENVAPLLRAKVQAGNNARVQSLRATLDEQIKGGDLDNANVTLAEIAKIDPTYAKAMSNKMERAWGRLNAQEKFNQQVKFYMDNGMSEQDAKNYTLYKNIMNPREQFNYNERQKAEAIARASAGRSGDQGVSRGSVTKVKEPSLTELKAREEYYQGILTEYADAKPGTPEYIMKNDAAAGIERIRKQILQQDHVVTPDEAYSVAWDAYSNGEPLENVIRTVANEFGTDVAFEVNRRLRTNTTPNPPMRDADRGYGVNSTASSTAIKPAPKKADKPKSTVHGGMQLPTNENSVVIPWIQRGLDALTPDKNNPYYQKRR